MVAVYGSTRFEFDEENDLNNYTVFLADVVHGTPPWRPLFFIESWGQWAYRAVQRGAERLSLPTTRGWDIRFIDGYPYPTVIETSEQEAKEREPVFRERIRPYIEDFDAVWEQLKANLMNAYQELKKKYGLKKYEDIKKLSNISLLELFDDYMQVDRLQWDVHMELMVPAFYLFGLFDQMCRELLGFGHTDPLFAKLMAGFDSTLFRFNKEIWRLGNRAVELGLSKLFSAAGDNEVLLSKLEDNANGGKWLKEYRDFLEVHGWRNERMLDWATPNWLEKPSLGIPLIKVAITTRGAYTMDERRERAVREREKAEKEVLTKVPAEQRGWFGALMKAAQKAGCWSEDHTYYCELYGHGMGRWITREIGRRFAEAGVIDDPEDVYFLIADEIEKALIPMGKVKLHRYVNARKKEWEGYLKLTPKPFYGNIEMVQEMLRKDPTISVSTSAPIVREELKADLYGAASAPGVVEGVARIIMTEDKLAEIQPGEILVAPGTSAPWTPAFEIIKGLITDGGGALCHAVIVAREYGIPAVTGCLEATRKIKTGDKVKVDGNLGVVYILR
jgi:phosphohistidine swiveling domain-containing protein